MSIAQKLQRKNKEPKAASTRARPNYMRAWIGWLPLAGALGLTGVVVLLTYELIGQGRLEGNVALTTGRYVEATLETGEIKGYLLPPPPKVAANATAGGVPSGTTSAMDSSGAVQIGENRVKLRDAPNMALVENSDVGMLPVISPDGTKPWQYYGRPFSKQGNVSLISVIVTGLGVHKEMSIAASRLLPDICLSVSPYAPDVPVWMQSMRVQGHEFLLDMPLQPANFPLTDPGPDALMVNIMPEENATRFKKILARSTGYIGFTVPSDEVFFQGEKDFVEPIVKEMANRGVMTVFSKLQDRPELNKILEEAKLVHLTADINIRYGADINEIVQEFSAAETVASKRGSALVVIQASPIALEELKKWTENLEVKGFQLAPVSVLARVPNS